ncbi:DUF3011 domain-containing protein [bacterium]|nr:DUF3011 domain-containing protein [bacterium]
MLPSKARSGATIMSVLLGGVFLSAIAFLIAREIGKVSGEQSRVQIKSQLDGLQQHGTYYVQRGLALSTIQALIATTPMQACLESNGSACTTNTFTNWTALNDPNSGIPLNGNFTTNGGTCQNASGTQDCQLQRNIDFRIICESDTSCSRYEVKIRSALADQIRHVPIKPLEQTYAYSLAAAGLTKSLKQSCSGAEVLTGFNQRTGVLCESASGRSSNSLLPTSKIDCPNNGYNAISAVQDKSSCNSGVSALWVNTRFYSYERNPATGPEYSCTCPNGAVDCNTQADACTRCAASQNMIGGNCVTPSWGAWSGWSGCNRACGGGTRTRTRSCQNARSGGATCGGSNRQTANCNTQPCTPPYTDILCESVNYQPNQCRSPYPVRAVIKLVQRSNRGCAFNSTWGHDSQKIWVNNGCRAIWRVYH